MRLALTGATIISSISPPSVATADILVEHGRVAAVGVPVPDGIARLDCSGCLVVPGNVCAHTHLYSALARGMPGAGPAPRSFIEILRRVWWRLDRALDDETIRASALLGGLEALRAGTTTVIDHHASPNAVDGSLDVIAEALAELGIRSVLCYETSDRDGPDVAAAGVAENARFIHAIDAGRWPLSRAMVGAHASFTLTRPTLDAVAALARDTGRGLHIHAAEDRIDETDARVQFGRSVGARLRDAGALVRGRSSHTVSTSIPMRRDWFAGPVRPSSTTRVRTSTTPSGGRRSTCSGRASHWAPTASARTCSRRFARRTSRDGRRL